MWHEDTRKANDEKLAGCKVATNLQSAIQTNKSTESTKHNKENYDHGVKEKCPMQSPWKITEVNENNTRLELKDADRKDATMSKEWVYSDNNNTNNVKNSSRGYPGGSVLKNPPANAGDSGSIHGSGRSLEKEKATHSSIFGGKSHGQRSLAGCSSMGSWSVRQDWATEQQPEFHWSC